MPEGFKEKYGPWAVVTGASDGIGRAFSLRLASKGVNVIAIARREGPLAALADEIRAMGVECITASIDLTQQDAPEKIIAAVGERDVGLFIANAGADCSAKVFLDRDAAAWNDLLIMNVNNTALLSHHFATAMSKRGRGGLILTGSGAGYGGIGGIAVYCGAKAFVMTFAEALWTELRRYGVDVLGLVVGRTDTPSYREILETNDFPVPEVLHTPDQVVDQAFTQLPDGPICNCGLTDDEPVDILPSAAQRRQRVIERDGQLEMTLAAANRNAAALT